MISNDALMAWLRKTFGLRPHIASYVDSKACMPPSYHPLTQQQGYSKACIVLLLLAY